MKKNTNNVQDAISDLAALRPNWSLLADTLPDEFLRQVKEELCTITSERDAHLATIRGTFSVLESRGQAPDDNAPLEVTVRRVLDFLDTMTAERDALAAQLAALKKRLADAVKSHAVSPWGGLSKGYAVGARTVDKPGRYALVRLEDGET